MKPHENGGSVQKGLVSGPEQFRQQDQVNTHDIELCSDVQNAIRASKAKFVKRRSSLASRENPFCLSRNTRYYSRATSPETPLEDFFNTPLLKWSVLVLVGFLLVSCSHWRDRYFDGGVDELTQFDVREKFGKPHIIEKSLLEKKTTWVYRIALPESDLDPSGLKDFGSGVSDLGDAVASLVGKGSQGSVSREDIVCLRYELIFDDERILREWTRKSCQLKKPENPFGGR